MPALYYAFNPQTNTFLADNDRCHAQIAVERTGLRDPEQGLISIPRQGRLTPAQLQNIIDRRLPIELYPCPKGSCSSLTVRIGDFEVWVPMDDVNSFNLDLSTPAQLDANARGSFAFDLPAGYEIRTHS
jgi:hypothetical protein